MENITGCRRGKEMNHVITVGESRVNRYEMYEVQLNDLLDKKYWTTFILKPNGLNENKTSVLCNVVHGRYSDSATLFGILGYLRLDENEHGVFIDNPRATNEKLRTCLTLNTFKKLVSPDGEQLYDVYTCDLFIRKSKYENDELMEMQNIFHLRTDGLMSAVKLNYEGKVVKYTDFVMNNDSYSSGRIVFQTYPAANLKYELLEEIRNRTIEQWGQSKSELIELF